MHKRLLVGSLGRTLTALAPTGEVQVLGAVHPARTAGETIEVGRAVLVTGFEPSGLLVREATPIEVADAEEPPFRGRVLLRERPPQTFGQLLLTFGQVVSVLGCIGSVVGCLGALVSAVQYRMPDVFGLPVLIWTVLGGAAGFFYSAAMFVVFSRVKRLPAG